MTFAELQDASGLAKSTTSRLLTALERSGLLERDAAGSYVAGRLFWLYAARHDPWDELVRLAHPTMERIGADTGETVHLSVARGDRVVQVAQVDSTLPPRHPRLDRGRRARPLLRARQGAPRLGRARPPRRARWSGSTTATHHRRPTPYAATAAAPASAAGPSPPTSWRSGLPASPSRSSACTATWSPRSASPGPTPDWTGGSTSSAATCWTAPRRCPPCCAAAPTSTPHPNARNQEVVA